MQSPRMACASSGEPLAWNRIDWDKYQRNVEKLQARIVKATREGRWGKVKSLQWLLTHSRSGKAFETGLHSESEWKAKTSWHSDDDGPRHAGFTSAGPRPGI
jgi:RNA-directed DNA polymerase